MFKAIWIAVAGLLFTAGLPRLRRRRNGRSGRSA